MTYEVALLADDLNISVDFFDYFAATYPILHSDPTVWCVSAWNDNGKRDFISDDAGTLLTQDYYPRAYTLLTLTSTSEVLGIVLSTSILSSYNNCSTSLPDRLLSWSWLDDGEGNVAWARTEVARSVSAYMMRSCKSTSAQLYHVYNLQCQYFPDFQLLGWLDAPSRTTWW